MFSVGVVLPSYTGAVIANVVKGAGQAEVIRSALIMGGLTLVR